MIQKSTENQVPAGATIHFEAPGDALAAWDANLQAGRVVLDDHHRRPGVRALQARARELSGRRLARLRRITAAMMLRKPAPHGASALVYDPQPVPSRTSFLIRCEATSGSPPNKRPSRGWRRHIRQRKASK